jgi:gamma-glutamylcyclotransferase (GGCT)/AIG2-like uncharacterized protein YtfP
MRETDTYEDLDELDDIFGDLNMTMLHSGEKHLVFVYGTLMNGMRNHDRLVRNKAQLVNENAYVIGNLSMKCKTMGDFTAPIVMQEPDHITARGVIGELYEISDQLLHALDAFEGHPDVYERKKVCVETKDKTEEAWMYYFVAAVPSDVSEENITVLSNTSGRYHYKWRGL